MLLFSTVLDIDASLTPDAFIRLVIEWNQGSPHEDGVIQEIAWNGERNIRYGDDKRWLDIEEYRNQNIIAVRYEKQESDGSVWDTDFVMNFSAMKMSVRLDRSYTPEALALGQRFATPHFIKLLIDRGYLRADGDLPVLDTPVMIKRGNLQIVSDIINGRKKYKLPVVYISRTYYDEEPVEVSRLAWQLKGVAHVLAQKSNATNPSLRELCGSKNEYRGAIGIYYPNSAVGHRKYQYQKSVGNDTFLAEKVVRAVVQYSNTQMVDTLYTWLGVNNALLKDKLAVQREERLAAETAKKRAEEKAKQLEDSLDEEEKRIRQEALVEAKLESNKILDSFDGDMQRMQKQIEELTKQTNALLYENQGLRAKLESTASVPVLYMGGEYDLYPGEIKDLILSVLSDSVSGIHPDTRRMDVVKDIIRANGYRKLSEQKAEKVKRVLKNYKGMTGRLRQELLDLGFEITEDGKHIKLTYYGDERYQTVFAKTPSDGRAGKNNTQNVIRSCF